GLPVPRTQGAGPGAVVALAVEPDGLAAEDQFVVGSGDEDGFVAVRGEVQPDPDGRVPLRAVVQQHPGPARLAHEQVEFAVHDPAEQRQCGDEVALARPVGTDEDVEITEVDRRRANRGEPLDGDRPDSVASHGTTLDALSREAGDAGAGRPPRGPCARGPRWARIVGTLPRTS